MIWRLALAAWITAAISFGALNTHAQIGQIPAWPPTRPSPPSGPYVGPGDIATGGSIFWSLGRAYNLAYATATSPLADLVDTATGALTCTLKVATSGFADLTSAVCPTGSPTTNVVTWCTATVGGCSATKLYDQTGTGNSATQATLANMATVTFAAQNGLPCLAGASGVSYSTSGSLSNAVPFTETFVGERTGSFTTVQGMIGQPTATIHGDMSFGSVANQVRFGNGSNQVLTASDSAFHALLAVASSTAPLFAADSSSNINTSSSGTNSFTSVFGFMKSANTSLIAGFACEGGLWPSDQNANYIALLANMRGANGWGF